MDERAHFTWASINIAARHRLVVNQKAVAKRVGMENETARDRDDEQTKLSAHLAF